MYILNVIHNTYNVGSDIEKIEFDTFNDMQDYIVENNIEDYVIVRSFSDD